MSPRLREEAGVAGRVVWTSILVVVAVLIVVGGLTAAYYKALPWQLDQQRNATEHSRQYITATVDDINELVQDVRNLEKEIADIKAANPSIGDTDTRVSSRLAQINASVNKMYDQAKSIPRDAVPQDALDILREYNKELPR